SVHLSLCNCEPASAHGTICGYRSNCRGYNGSCLGCWSTSSRRYRLGRIYNSRLSESIRPGLTSVNQPRNAMGQLAMQFLTERFEGRTQPRREVMTPELVIRSSSGFEPSSM